MLQIREAMNVGRAKYLVNYYTGKKHQDGSAFYDLAIFPNRKAKVEFVNTLSLLHQNLDLLTACNRELATNFDVPSNQIIGVYCAKMGVSRKHFEAMQSLRVRNPTLFPV